MLACVASTAVNDNGGSGKIGRFVSLTNQNGVFRGRKVIRKYVRRNGATFMVIRANHRDRTSTRNILSVLVGRDAMLFVFFSPIPHVLRPSVFTLCLLSLWPNPLKVYFFEYQSFLPASTSTSFRWTRPAPTDFREGSIYGPIKREYTPTETPAHFKMELPSRNSTTCGNA